MTASNTAYTAKGMTLGDWVSLIGKTVRAEASCELFPEIHGMTCVIKSARRANNGIIAVTCSVRRKGIARDITLDTGMRGLRVTVIK